MKIHEYQAKEILGKFDVAVPRGGVASTEDDAVKVAQDIRGDAWVIKAQIHAGGRGKGGGIKLARELSEVRQLASNMLGMRLVTHQTGPEGRIVKRLLIEQGVRIAKELYAGITLDRSRSQNVLMASTEGGVEIEKVAAETPELIFKEYIDPVLGLRPFQCRRLAFKLGISGETLKSAVRFFTGLYRAYESMDASLVEINPLVLTKEGTVLALDAKINFDDNALYRHAEVVEMRDLYEEAPL
ncbi:MAG: ATP-grasp domain-containing protein, partial [Bacteroidota bacterium]